MNVSESGTAKNETVAQEKRSGDENPTWVLKQYTREQEARHISLALHSSIDIYKGIMCRVLTAKFAYYQYIGRETTILSIQGGLQGDAR